MLYVARLRLYPYGSEFKQGYFSVRGSSGKGNGKYHSDFVQTRRSKTKYENQYGTGNATRNGDRCVWLSVT